MKRKFCVIMGCIIILLSPIVNKININAAAYEKTNETVDKITIEDLKIYENDIRKYIETFANHIEKSKKVSTENIVPVYDNDDQIVGCCVSLVSGKKEYGYVNLDFRSENMITDFSIALGASSPVEVIIEKIKDNAEKIKKIETKKLYKVDFVDYGVGYIDDNGKKRYMVGTDDMNNKEFEHLQDINEEFDEKMENSSTTTKYSSFSKIWSSGVPGQVTETATYIKQYSKPKSLISESSVENATNKYACAVVALTEIAQQENISNSSLKTTFNNLWNKTGTTIDHTMSGITYGTTQDSKLASGMKSYATSRNASCTCTTKSNPPVSFFVNAVKNNLSSTLSMRILKTSGETSGHTVSVVGYCKSYYSAVTHTYVIVANGWYSDAPVFIDYNNVDFVNTYGVTYDIG